MGFPPRLNGKSTPLPSDETETCPSCHRKFPVYDVVNEENRAMRKCPFCGHEFYSNNDNSGNRSN